MPTTYYPTQVERWAHSAWKRLKLRPPCDLQAVSDFLRIRVERRPLPNDLYGLYMRLPDGTQAIKVNSGLMLPKQRFVWAHEIGHALLTRYDPGELVVEFRAGGHHAQERECDLFAAHLLMPEKLLRNECARLGHPELHNKTRTLARLFGVSASAMAIRLRELGLVHVPNAR